MGLLDYLRRAVPKKADAEALLALASGAVAEPAAGLAGLYGLATGGLDKGASNIERTREALTYHPRDTSSLEALARVTDPVLGRIERGKQYLGDATFDATGSPALATAARVAPDALLTLLGARTAGIKGPTLREIAENSASHYPMGSPGSQIGAIRAYHGSPHDFDRFSMANIGTGEGAQAYGHGLYFAGKKDVAEMYRRELSDAATHNDFNGKLDNFLQVFGDSPGAVLAAKAAMSSGGSAADVAAEIRRMAGMAVPEAEAFAPQAAEHFAAAPWKRNDGNLYEAELAPDEADLLDWDAPLSEQPGHIQKLAMSNSKELVKRLKQYKSNPHNEMSGGETIWSHLNGADLYNALGDKKAAAEALRAAGIPGIRYLDAGSRAAGDGSRNYVMFDDNLIKILRKNGAPNP